MVEGYRSKTEEEEGKDACVKGYRGKTEEEEE